MKFFALFFLFSTLTAFGHGENKPGPHGGHIRMPGAFHTELLLENKTAKVYLLDMAFKNPTNKDSSVFLKGANDAKMVTCKAQDDYFVCPVSESQLKQKALIVVASRKGLKGRQVSYPLPLSFKSKTKSTMDHSQHQGH